MAQRVTYRGPRPKGRPPVYKNAPIDRDEALNLIIAAAERMGYQNARFTGPIPAGDGYDVRMPVECLLTYSETCFRIGINEVLNALAELPDHFFDLGRDAVVCAIFERFLNEGKIA